MESNRCPAERNHVVADFDYDIGIIGGGAAGLTVAAGAAQLGAKTLLVEKEPKLGGDCLHYGCVPSKTLIKSAKVYHLMKHAPDYGLPLVDLGPVDFSKIAARIRGVIETIQHHDSEERFCSLGAKVEFGDPRFTDPHSIQLNGKIVSAKQWVLATGSEASAPPLPGLADTPYLTNREVFSLEALPESMTILGGGPIAIEMAQAFNRLGSKVHVVQRSGQILSKEDPDMADLVKKSLEQEGVVFHLNAGVESVRDLGNQREVVIKDSSGTSVSIKAEQILAALGQRPNTQGLGLEEIGVELERGAIKVNNRLRTSIKHIYACGDVTGQYQFTHAAGYEGSVVVANAIFHLPRKVDYTFLPWCTYTDPELGSIGLNEKRAEQAGIKYKTIIEEFADNDRAQAEGRVDGRIKMLLDDKEKVIGVQILGQNAGDLLGEWAAVLGGKVKLSTLAAIMHPYPTLCEINKRAAGQVLAPKVFSPTVKKGLSLFFSLKGRACGEESGQANPK
jgi:pyruvate/2-oxoglutarate dehydrogenase complex dihydrolipoamide dehydrogenase (E3) component